MMNTFSNDPQQQQNESYNKFQFSEKNDSFECINDNVQGLISEKSHIEQGVQKRRMLFFPTEQERVVFDLNRKKSDTCIDAFKPSSSSMIASRPEKVQINLQQKQQQSQQPELQGSNDHGSHPSEQHITRHNINNNDASPNSSLPPNKSPVRLTYVRHKNNNNYNTNFSSSQQQQMQLSKPSEDRLQQIQLQQSQKKDSDQNKMSLLKQIPAYNSQWKMMSRIKNVKKFLERIREKIFFRNFQDLTDHQLQYIGDCTYFSNSNVQTSNNNKFLLMLKFYYTNIATLVQQIPSMAPNCKVVLVLDILLFLYILGLSFFLPVNEGFRINLLQSGFMQALSTDIPIVIFIFEILLQINTSYYEDGINLVTDRKKILLNYVYNHMWRDVVATIALIMSLHFDVRIVSMAFLVKLFQLSELKNKILEAMELWLDDTAVYQLTKLILLISFAAHLCACGYHFLGTQTAIQGESCNWIERYNLSNEGWDVRYLNALYFMFISIATVGYGDIVPKCNQEKIYIIIVTLIGSCIFAFSVNTIGTIFSEIAKKSNTYKKQKQEIGQYMKCRNISNQTQIKILKYLEYINKNQDLIQHQGEKVLYMMSSSLREEVQKEYYGKILERSRIFSKHFSSSFLQNLSLCMKETTLGPGEILFKKDDLDQKFIFLNKGEIELYLDQQFQGRKDFVIGNIKENEFFGEMNFFGGLQAVCNARSVNISHLIYCTQSDFLKVIKNYTSDYEQFCMIKEDITLLNKKIGEFCHSCGKLTHSILQCQYLHYQAFRESVILKYNYPIQQQRQSWKRRNRKSNAIKVSKVIREALKEYRLDVVTSAVQEPILFQLYDKNISDSSFLEQVPTILYDTVEEDFIIDIDAFDLNKIQKIISDEDNQITNNNQVLKNHILHVEEDNSSDQILENEVEQQQEHDRLQQQQQAYTSLERISSIKVEDKLASPNSNNNNPQSLCLDRSQESIQNSARESNSRNQISSNLSIKLSQKQPSSEENKEEVSNQHQNSSGRQGSSENKTRNIKKKGSDIIKRNSIRKTSIYQVNSFQPLELHKHSSSTQHQQRNNEQQQIGNPHQKEDSAKQISGLRLDISEGSQQQETKSLRKMETLGQQKIIQNLNSGKGLYDKFKFTSFYRNLTNSTQTHTTQQVEPFYIDEFDQMKGFQNYRIYNNYTVVLKQLLKKSLISSTKRRILQMANSLQ